VRLQQLSAGLGALVSSSQVHPEEQAAHRGPDLALPELVLSDSLGVQDAAAGSELQERSGLQPSALEAATGTGGVAGARRARDRVPQVVEPAVGVRGVLVRHLRRDPDGGLVDQDERVDHRVGDVPRRQGFQDALAHHRANVGLLYQDDFALRCVNLSGHRLLLHVVG
jgi:hypothetical protein